MKPKPQKDFYLVCFENKFNGTIYFDLYFTSKQIFVNPNYFTDSVYLLKKFKDNSKYIEKKIEYSKINKELLNKRITFSTRFGINFINHIINNDFDLIYKNNKKTKNENTVIN